MSSNPTNLPSPDVLIVGGGPVGLTMASTLTHHGLTCRLIDKAPAPSDKSNSLAVWSRTFPTVLTPHLILNRGVALPSVPVQGIPTWIDATGRLHEKLYANDRTLVLVRPDGYIGYRCQPANSAALIEYMSRYLVRERDEKSN